MRAQGGEQDEGDREWPPGTVRLGELPGHEKSGSLALYPQPTRDANDPLNWRQGEKYVNFGLACFYTFLIFALIDMATPTWGPMNKLLGFSYETLNFSYAVGCATLAVGSVLLIPFALKFGRRPIYILSCVCQLGLSVWSARLKTVTDLMLINALTCFVGAVAEVLVPMTVSDLFFVHERGTMNGIFVWAIDLGASLAPVAAGYMTTSQGWRWVWWWNAIFFGAAVILFFFAFEETKFDSSDSSDSGFSKSATSVEPNPDPVREPAALAISTLASEQGEGATSLDQDGEFVIPRKRYRERLAPYSLSPGPFSKFARHWYQPFQILFTIPAVFFVSLVYGTMLAAGTVMITTLSSWMASPPYDFDASQIGLMSLPAWLGTTLGVLASGPLSDWLIVHLARRNGGIYEPEMRLWVIIAFIPFVPAGTFMFGLGLDRGSHWAVIATGYALTNFGGAPASTMALTYLTDAYTEILGDSLVAVAFTRNLVSTLFVFALTPWIQSMGLSNVYITIGLVLTAVLAGTLVFIFRGKRMRVNTTERYRYYASRQFESRPI